MPHCAAYVQVFMEIDAVLSEKNACASSRLHFVSAKVLYGCPLKEARAPAALGTPSASSNANSRSSLEVTADSSVCCRRDCLVGNLIAGVDAMEYWMKRAANERTQRAKQVMIRNFYCQFPGICRNAAQAVLRVSRDSITQARKTPSASSSWFDRSQRSTFTSLELCSRSPCGPFRDIYCWLPEESIGLGAPQLRGPVNGKKGFWKLFRRMNPQLDCKARMFMRHSNGPYPPFRSWRGSKAHRQCFCIHAYQKNYPIRYEDFFQRSRILNKTFTMSHRSKVG